MSDRPSLGDEVRVAAEIAAQIQAAGIDAEDPDFATLLEAECDVVERVRRIVRAARFTEAQSKALGEMQADMRERRARLDSKAESLRRAALWALQEMGLPKLQAPDFTASIGHGRPKIVVTDEAALPDPYFRTKREVDKAALLSALQGGPVLGAELANPEPIMTIRSK
ncbi:siphovirus Gp157 family protein [Methylobacterium nigriterrae]|uniref:siphovirus Gp157 family protein n=1 Tax=Methylobacterium nigriterrae TaxID=3127512 RepID=UPI003013B0D5